MFWRALLSCSREVGRAREKLGEHEKSWESTKKVERARKKLGEHEKSWESTKKVGRARKKRKSFSRQLPRATSEFLVPCQLPPVI